MKTHPALWLVGCVIGVVGVAAMAAGPNADGVPACPLDPQLTVEEEADIAYMREEEKLARDVYLTLETMWPVQAFSNIATAEQNHMDAVYNLIDCYGVIDPVVDDTVGVFTDPDLAQLYLDLTAAGALSELDALMVGALIEETDVADLRAAIAQTDQQMIIAVYENLLSGSMNHLRAFDRLIGQRGATYTPVVLTQEDYDAIVGDPPAQGGKRHRLGRPVDTVAVGEAAPQTRERAGVPPDEIPNDDADAVQRRLQDRDRDCTP